MYRVIPPPSVAPERTFSFWREAIAHAKACFAAAQAKGLEGRHAEVFVDEYRTKGRASWWKNVRILTPVADPGKATPLDVGGGGKGAA